MAIDASIGVNDLRVATVNVDEFMFADLMYQMTIKLAESCDAIRWVRLLDVRGVERKRWDAP